MSVDIRPNPASSGAVTGGLVYKGSYNATTNSPDLTSSTKGDFYIVSVGGTLAGITLNVGDHIVFNQDASSPITSAMFDVIDNTDAVASVNGATGVVVLGASDVSALAIANNLSDLNNATTARTNLGLGTAATEDVGTGANDIVQLDGSSRLPAVDGSQLTNITATDSTKLAIANNLSDLNNAGTARTNLGVAIGSDVQAYDAQLADIAGLTPTDSNFIVGNGTNFVLESGATARASLSLGTAATEDVGTGASNVVQLDGSSRLPAVDGSLLTNITATDSTKLAIANNLSDLNNASTARTNLGVAIGSDVQAYDAQLADIAGLTPTDSNFIVGNGTNFVTESGATARASLSLGSAATEDVGTGASNVVQLDGSSRLPAVDGSQLTNITATDSTKLAIANNLSDLNNAGTARTNLGVAIGSDVQAYDAQLADIAGLTPTDGNIIIGNGTNFITESGATARTSLGLSIGTDVQAYDAQLADIAGLTPTDSNFIVGNGTNFVTESGATARASLSLGTAATEDVGTGANNVVQLDGSSRLPAVDGSQLTNLPSGGGGFTYTPITSASSPVTSSTSVHYGADSSGGAITFNLPALSGLTGGEEIRIKLNTAGNNLTITPNGSDTIEGAASYVMSIAKEAVTCVASNGTNWEII